MSYSQWQALVTEPRVHSQYVRKRKYDPFEGLAPPSPQRDKYLLTCLEVRPLNLRERSQIKRRPRSGRKLDYFSYPMENYWSILYKRYESYRDFEENKPIGLAKEILVLDRVFSDYPPYQYVETQTITETFTLLPLDWVEDTTKMNPCKYCNRDFETIRGCKMHMKYCKQN